MSSNNYTIVVTSLFFLFYIIVSINFGAENYTKQKEKNSNLFLRLKLIDVYSLRLVHLILNHSATVANVSPVKGVT